MPIKVLPTTGDVLVAFDGGEYLSFTEKERTNDLHLKNIQGGGVKWKFLYEDDLEPLEKKKQYRLRPLKLDDYFEFTGDVEAANKFLSSLPEPLVCDHRVEKCSGKAWFLDDVLEPGMLIVATSHGEETWIETMTKVDFEGWFEEVEND